MTQLLPCPSCARHVRRNEQACPFCSASVSFPEPGVASVMPRLGRAALFTFGTALATSGCVGNAVPLYGAPAPDTGLAADAAPASDAGTDAAVLAMYGGPPQDAGSDAGSPGPLYGAPAFDAGFDHDTGGASADYGAPPAPPA
jgi:hypothetical protein